MLFFCAQYQSLLPFVRGGVVKVCLVQLAAVKNHRLLLSLLIWPKVITLSGFYCTLFQVTTPEKIFVKLVKRLFRSFGTGHLKVLYFQIVKRSWSKFSSQKTNRVMKTILLTRVEILNSWAMEKLLQPMKSTNKYFEKASEK